MINLVTKNLEKKSELQKGIEPINFHTSVGLISLIDEI